MASCAEVPEANGQGLTKEECLKDLTDSIQSVLEYRRDEALASLDTQAKQTVVDPP